MAGKITEDMRDEMFHFWCLFKPKYGWEKAVKELAKRCKICERTVAKYKDVDEWDKRLEAIQLQTRSGTDYDIVKERRKNLTLIRAAKVVYAQQLKSDTLKGKVKLADIDSLIRLELLLVGEPDSRTGIVSETQKRENIIGILEGIKANGKK